jgi:hypothetical protein
MRLNVGKYGQLNKSEKPLDGASTALNMSDKEYEQERRSFGGGGGSRGGSRGGYGGGGRDRRGGYGDRGGDREGGDRPSYMNKGRRRF